MHGISLNKKWGNMALIQMLEMLVVNYLEVKNKELQQREPLSRSLKFFCLMRPLAHQIRKMNKKCRLQSIKLKRNLDPSLLLLQLIDCQPSEMLIISQLCKRERSLNRETMTKYQLIIQMDCILNLFRSNQMLRTNHKNLILNQDKNRN